MNNGYSRFVRQGGALLLALQLAACGGGGSSSGGGSSGDGGSSNDGGDSSSGTYTIGGTVTGANGNLTLENNGTDSLEVAGVSFEFPTELEDGSDYNVTVAQPPEDQLCSVDSASGTVAGADVDDVEVLCRGTVRQLSGDQSEHMENPRIAVDSDGNAIALWNDDVVNEQSLYANRYTVSNDSWGGEQLIVNGANGPVDNPQIAVDSDGNAIAVWSQDDGDYDSIYAKRYRTSDNSWAPTQQLESIDVGDAENPQIAFDSEGNAMAVWSQDDEEHGSTTSIYANRYRASENSWVTAQSIEDGDESAYDPQIAFDSNGNAMAVWTQKDGNDNYISIQANYRPADDQTWTAGAAQLIEDRDDGSADNPQVAFDSDGDAIAVWEQDDGEYNNIYANRYTAGSGWHATANRIENNDSEGAGDAGAPQIAIDSDGNAIAVWEQIDNDGSGNLPRLSIYASRYRISENSWVTAQSIEDGDDSAHNPQIAFDSNGNAIAVWGQDTGSQSDGIYANHYTADTNSWAAAERIEDETEKARNPQLAIGSGDHAIAVWEQQDYYFYIYANHFE